jgi:omega-hydroxy-beta-dihydromenaquinone-9 sulfotransferase
VTSSWSRPLFNLDLAAWRGLRRRYPSPLPGSLSARACLAGTLFSALQSWQAHRYRAVLDAVSLEPPLFVIGHWRSGTSWLHELLALDSGFATPRSYACFNPHHFLLTRHYQPAPRQVTRPTGDLAVSPTSPQEEEFALLCMGAPSPYAAFLLPAALEDFEALSDPGGFPPPAARGWDNAFTWFARAVAYSEDGSRLLMKSPANSFRVARLRSLFAGARFILIVRDPLAVFASTLHMWHSMWDRYALAPPPPEPRLIERVFAIGLAMEQRLAQAGAGLPPDTIVTIRYEELSADPYRAAAGLYERLRLTEPAGLRASIAAYMAAHPSPAGARNAQPWRDRVRHEWAAIYDRYGY